MSDCLANMLAKNKGSDQMFLSERSAYTFQLREDDISLKVENSHKLL